jgi:hypothetical protein
VGISSWQRIVSRSRVRLQFENFRRGLLTDPQEVGRKSVLQLHRIAPVRSVAERLERTV